MKKYFEYTDEVSNKFWQISLKGKQVIITFGRIEIKNPPSQLKEFSSNDEAKKYAERKIREKTNKGYIEKSGVEKDKKKIHKKKPIKKIEHLYKNFNINKFLELVPSYKDGSAFDFAELIIKCIDGYNDKDDEDELFISYLKDLLKTGEFFIKLKKYFHIEEYFSSVVVEETLWNEAFVLFCKKDKKFRLIIAHYGSVPSNDCIHIVDTADKYDLKTSLKELNKFNKQYHDIDKETGKSEYNLNAPDFKISAPHTSPESYYNSFHKEAMEMEHEE